MQESALNEAPHHYAVYGVTLACNREIPGLVAENIARGNIADIRINIGAIPRDIEHLMGQHAAPYYVEPGYEKNDPAHLIVTRAPDGRYFEFIYANGVRFFLDTQASAIWCGWKDPETLEDVALYLLGPILGFMLRLRGTTCLHASGVFVDGHAFAITGASGAG